MSLEEQLKEHATLLHANTQALLRLEQLYAGGNAKPPVATVTSAAKTATPEEPKRGRGRPPKAKPEEVEGAGSDGDLDLGDGGDDGLGDDGLGDEPQYSFADLMNLMLSLRDIGGKGANKDDCRAVIKKFGVTNFKELEGQEDKYDNIATAIKALATKRKVEL